MKFCDYCGRPEIVVISGLSRLNIPCTHSDKGNQVERENAHKTAALPIIKRK